MKSLFLIFNHALTNIQRSDAETSLGVERIIELPDELRPVWGQITPDAVEIGPLIQPVKSWLAKNSRPGDYVLIQGDFGACYLMVEFCFQTGLVPVYSTTIREAVEIPQADGSVKMEHKFRHRIFRRYGK